MESYTPAEPTTFDELLDLLERRPAWHHQAACRDHPELTWFPERGASLRAAKAVCAACPVRGACLAWALEHDDALAGVWGGLSVGERVQLRRGGAA